MMARAPWIPAVAALTLTLGLAACDGGEEAQPEQSPGETNPPTSEASNGGEREARSTPAQTGTEEGQPGTASADGAAQGEGSTQENDEVTSSASADVDPGQAEEGTGTTDNGSVPDEGERLADESWENTEDDVSEALKETERRFREAEKELEEQFKAAEEQDVQRGQEIQIQPEEAPSSQ
jgi:hypothetical protein